MHRIIISFALLVFACMFIEQECPIEGQVFTACGTACPLTCNFEPRVCTSDCVVGCQCPPGTVLDEANNKCVKKEDCGMNNANIAVQFSTRYTYIATQNYYPRTKILVIMHIKAIYCTGVLITYMHST